MHDHVKGSVRLSPHHPGSISMSLEAHLCKACRAQVQLPVLEVLDGSCAETGGGQIDPGCFLCC